jgi:hypothetical protein
MNALKVLLAVVAVLVGASQAQAALLCLLLTAVGWVLLRRGWLAAVAYAALFGFHSY